MKDPNGWNAEFQYSEETEGGFSALTATNLRWAAHEMLHLVIEDQHRPVDFAEDLSWAWTNGKDALKKGIESFAKRLENMDTKSIFYRRDASERMRIAWQQVDGPDGLSRYLLAALEYLDDKTEEVSDFKNGFIDKTIEEKLKWLIDTGGQLATYVAAAVLRGQSSMLHTLNREKILFCIPGYEKQGEDDMDDSFDFGMAIENPFEDEEEF